MVSWSKVKLFRSRHCRCCGLCAESRSHRAAVAILTKFGRVATVATDQTPQKLERRAQIPPDLGGERVDKVAAQLFSEFSRAELTRWIGEGALTLNGDAVKPKYKVIGGELLELRGQRQSREDWQSAEAMHLDILFEDEDLLVVNKPAGLVVHPGAGNADGTLVNARCTIDLAQELPRQG